jgi:hypothetical protein
MATSLFRSSKATLLSEASAGGGGKGGGFSLFERLGKAVFIELVVVLSG